jgi:hypothetical protein
MNSKRGGSKKKEQAVGRKDQVRFGTRAGMSQKTKEMPVYDRLLRFCSTRTKEVEAREKLRFKVMRLETHGPGRGGISDGEATHRNKPNRFKFWWVNQIDRFRPKQTQVIYLPCCQLDTTKFGPVF